MNILVRLYLSVHPCRLVLDQLLGEGPDHKNLRVLFDLGWPWKISPGFKFSSNLESIWETDLYYASLEFQVYWVIGLKGMYLQLPWSKRNLLLKLLILFLCVLKGSNETLLVFNKWITDAELLLRREMGLSVTFLFVHF